MGEKADDKLKQVPYAKWYEPALKGIIKGIGKQQWKDAYAKYTGAVDAYQPTRQANIPLYQQQYQDVYDTKSPGIEDFTAAISAAFAPIKEHSRDILDYGTAKIKGLLAARGEGNQGLSSSQQILNSTNAAINMANAFQPAYASVAPYFANMAAGRQADVDRKLGLLAGDYLNAPADAAAQSHFLPFLAQRQLQGVDLDLLGRAGELQRGNIAGWKTVPGLSTRLDDSAQGFMNLANFSTSLAGSIAGMGGGAGGLGGAMGGGGSQQQLANNEAARFSQDLTSQGYLSPNSTYAPVMRDLYPTTSTMNTYGQSFNPNALPYTPSATQNPWNPYAYRLY